MSWTRSTLPIARRQLGLSGIGISPSAPFRLSRRCRARCGRGRSTPKSPTSRQRRSSPPSASNRLLQASAAGSRSNWWASRFLARAGVGWYRGAQRDLRATFFACFAARTLYLARTPTLPHGGSRSRLLHQWACGLSLRKARRPSLVVADGDWGAGRWRLILSPHASGLHLRLQLSPTVESLRVRGALVVGTE
jgi:hypothetical protein